MTEELWDAVREYVATVELPENEDEGGEPVMHPPTGYDAFLIRKYGG